MGRFARMLEYLLKRKGLVKAPDDVEKVLLDGFSAGDVRDLLDSDLVSLLQSLTLREALHLAKIGEEK